VDGEGLVGEGGGGLMVRSVASGDRRVWVMPPDESLFDWFSIVRVANVQSIRWVLDALNGQHRPVSVRQAQAWCARVQTAGMVDRAQLGGAGGSLVCATYAGTGLAKLNLYRQTTRHEVAVAAASARYAAAGYAWRRDDKPAFAGGYQADGIALAPRWVELIEVGLTPKRMPARTVRGALRSSTDGRAIADRVAVHEVYDRAGLWTDDALPDWLPTAAQRMG
jgi:hypothetical protein